MRFPGPPTSSQIQKTPVYPKERPVDIEPSEKKRKERNIYLPGLTPR